MTADFGTPKWRVAFANIWMLSLFHRSSSENKEIEEGTTCSLVILAEFHFRTKLDKQLAQHLVNHGYYSERPLRSPVP